MNYETVRVITIGIIIICLLAIIFKTQIKRLFKEGFATSEPSTTTNSTTTSTTQSQSIDKENTTTSLSNTDESTLTTTSTTEPTSAPIEDVTDIKYTYKVAGYVPVLDIILTRLILFKVWEADWANLNTTQLAALDGVDDEATSPSSPSIAEINQNQKTLYPVTYNGNFEAFFTAELGKIPRLNVFIPNDSVSGTGGNSTNSTNNLYMDIVFTNFSKPEWVTKMAQYYKDPSTLTESVEDYVAGLKGELPQTREGNTSNTYSAREISDLKSHIMPIELREKIERLNMTELLINLIPGSEPPAISKLAPMFNELTQGLLTYISAYYPTLNILYVRVDDDDTRVLLGLTKEDVYTTDDLPTSTLVSDVRRPGSWTLANMLGYPDKNGIKYITRVLFNNNQGAAAISRLLGSHTKQIKLLARRALLQNSAFGTNIPNNLLAGHDGVETVTDNIYTYYFNIRKDADNMPAECNYRHNKPECFNTMERDRIFLNLAEGGHLNKIYPDLSNLKEEALAIEEEYNNAVTSGMPEPDQKKIKMRLDDTNSRISFLTKKIPYVIYLPIYDFQFIKIIPKRIKGDIFKPDPVMNF